MESSDIVLEFWFGTLDASGFADAAHAQRWWQKDAAFDALISERFGALHEAIARGAHEDWLATPRGRLAYVIVLDQFSRNMFRGSARAFAHDAQALEAAREGVERGDDRSLAYDERGFLYMPLMHSERLEDQERCLALFAALRDASTGSARDRANNSVDFAERHRDIVQRFGRFPHRNQVLGRTSTTEEIEFLREPRSSF
jgi:uncharacterized protein (DUF924 family)